MKAIKILFTIIVITIAFSSAQAPKRAMKSLHLDNQQLFRLAEANQDSIGRTIKNIFKTKSRSIKIKPVRVAFEVLMPDSTLEIVYDTLYYIEPKTKFWKRRRK